MPDNLRHLKIELGTNDNGCQLDFPNFASPFIIEMMRHGGFSIVSALIQRSTTIIFSGFVAAIQKIDLIPSNRSL